MGSRVYLRKTEYKTRITVFVYKKMNLYFSGEHILV